MISEYPTTKDPDPPTIEEIALSYTASIVLRRWLGCVIDYIILLLVFLLPVLMSKDETSSGTIYLLFALAILYFPLMEHLTGRSVGKLLAGIIVVGKNGQLPGLIPVILRTLARLIEVNPVLLGRIPAGLIVLASDKRQRLGDMLAGTYVIKFEDYVAYLKQKQ